jgi:type I restriction enzyme S subunit
LFEAKVQPIYEAILNNANESIHLAALRDTLLPRLMSGELSVAGLNGAK